MAKKILIVEVNWIGDVLFSTPFIRAVRDANPGSHVACLIHPRTKEILDYNPGVDELIVYDEEGIHRSILGKLSLIRMLKKAKFDTAYILHRSFTKALITYLASIPVRIGYAGKNRSSILTTAVPLAAREPHKVEYFLGLARASGIEPSSVSYEFYIKDTDRGYVQGLLGSDDPKRAGPLITICPGGNWDMKRWPKENFAKVADLLAQSTGARIAIAGAEKDTELANKIKSLMKHSPVITCGRTSLKELGALLELSDLVIANDTGPMHMAVAMKTRVISLFGPTSPALTGPYGEGLYKVIFKNDSCGVPCYDFSCYDNSCMSQITVDDVLREAAILLGKGRITT